MDSTVMTAVIGATATILAALIGATAARAKNNEIKELKKESADQTAQINAVRRGKNDMIIESGKFQATYKDSSWQLLKGQGPRPFEKRINFPQPFKAPPVVFVSLTGLDVSREANCRVRIEAHDIDRNGFTIHFSTWSNTQVYGLWAEWLAYGV